MSSEKALEEALEALDMFQGTVHHTLGNHELYCFDRDELLNSRLNSSSKSNVGRSWRDRSYYAFSPHPQFCFIVLDTYTFSVLGYKKDDPVFTKAYKLLRYYNSNTNFNDPTGLEGADVRFCAYNGGVDEDQLQWLDETLTEAEKKMQKVVIMGHQPLLVDACVNKDYITICWNYDEVLAVMHKHSNVLAYFAGHDHQVGRAIDEANIHHITFPGVIETPPGLNDYGTISVYSNSMYMQGSGRVPSIEIAKW